MTPERLPLATDIIHWRFIEPLCAGPASFTDRAKWLGDLAGLQLKQVCGARDAREETVFLCTTILSMLVVLDTPHREAMLNSIHAASGIRPQGFLQSYQCAGWGFALRAAAKLHEGRSGTICIIDSDLHRSPIMHFHPTVGAMGFGITTIRFASFGTSGATICDGPYPNSAFKEMMHSLRADTNAGLASTTHLPFLPANLAVLARRLLQPASVAPDLHAEYGHCFGSDSWIGVIRALEDGGSSAEPQIRRVSAIANNGYFAHSTVRFAPDLRRELSDI